MVDIDYLKSVYFTFDLPVPYNLKCGKTIEVKPISLLDSMVFISSCGILQIDKNASSNVDIIQMPYLKFLATEAVNKNPEMAQQFVNICILCLDFKKPFFNETEKGKINLCNLGENNQPDLVITAKEFDDIKKIILYQNLPNYDDEYVNPDLKKNMEEMNKIRSAQYVPPSLERRIAIISAHTGIPKSEQCKMSMRAHSMLYDEVRGEVEYSAMKAIACFGGKGEEVQWINQKKKGKFDDYITTKEEYNKSMGGDGNVMSSNQQSDFSLQYDKIMGGN